jgi:hypothetical protein
MSILSSRLRSAKFGCTQSDDDEPRKVAVFLTSGESGKEGIIGESGRESGKLGIVWELGDKSCICRVSDKDDKSGKVGVFLTSGTVGIVGESGNAGIIGESGRESGKLGIVWESGDKSCICIVGESGKAGIAVKEELEELGIASSKSAGAVGEAGLAVMVGCGSGNIGIVGESGNAGIAAKLWDE